jgi:hypothetical protein
MKRGRRYEMVSMGVTPPPLKATCAERGYWLGNTSAVQFTVVDTPGADNKHSHENASVSNLDKDTQSFCWLDQDPQ